MPEDSQAKPASGQSHGKMSRLESGNGAEVVVGNAIKTLSKDFGKILREQGQESLNDEAAKMLKKSQEAVAAVCRLTGIKNLEFSIVTGIQGAGKGVNDEAKKAASAEFIKNPDFDEMPDQLQKYIKANAGGIKHIATGTNGISFYPDDPKNEYTQLFGESGIKELAKKGTFTPDNAMTVLCNLMLAKRIFEAARENPGTDSAIVQFDLWPRTDVQAKHAQESIDLLKSRGIKAKLSVLDLKLLSPKDLENFLIVKDMVADFGPTVAKFLGEIALPYCEHQEKEKDKNTVVLESLRDLLPRMEDNTNQPIGAKFWLMELNASIDRVLKRGREDDLASALVKRLKSQSSVAKFILNLPQLKVVATEQLPAEVVRDIILIETELNANNLFVEAFIKRAGEIATALVARH